MTILELYVGLNAGDSTNGLTMINILINKIIETSSWSINSDLFTEYIEPTEAPKSMGPSTTQQILTYSESSKRTHPETVSQVKGGYEDAKVFDFSQVGRQTGTVLLHWLMFSNGIPNFCSSENIEFPVFFNPFCN